MTAAAAMALSVAAGPVKAAPTQPVKNIVFVHGAFADGSSWAKVITILQAKGYNVTAVQNPLTSFADDVAATNRALALQTGPVILVGHSWGGVVITEVGVDPKVVGLVYVAALAPDSDEVVSDIGKSYPPPPTFADPIVEGHLDRLAHDQQPDGGWPLTWEPPSTASTLEYRGIETLRALRVLSAYGHLRR